MKTTLIVLGVIAMLCAPFMWAETYFYAQGMKNSPLTGWCDLLYMTGWSCSIVALIRIKAAGRYQKVLFLQLGLLCVANIWNTWVILDPANDSLLFHILDAFWPASNLFMIITGIAVVRAKKLRGLARFVPLFAGFWLPVTMAAGMGLQDETISYYVMNLYATCAFLLLGAVVLEYGVTVNKERPRTAFEF